MNIEMSVHTISTLVSTSARIDVRLPHNTPFRMSSAEHMILGLLCFAVICIPIYHPFAENLPCFIPCACHDFLRARLSRHSPLHPYQRYELPLREGTCCLAQESSVIYLCMQVFHPERLG